MVRSVLFVGILIASLFNGVSPAYAFDSTAEYCSDDLTQSLKFIGSDWDQINGDTNLPMRTIFGWGYNAWKHYGRKWNGSYPISGGSDLAIDVVSTWELPLAFYGITLCSGNPLRTLLLEGDLKDDATRGIYIDRGDWAGLKSSRWEIVQGFAAHELGHAFGLGHSGIFASMDGRIPTMSTCITGTTHTENNGGYRQNLAQDDWAAVAHLTEKHSSGWTAITANNSFETGTQFWGVTPDPGVSQQGLGHVTGKSVNGGNHSGRLPGGHYATNGSRITEMKDYEVGVSSTAPFFYGEGHNDITWDKIKGRINYRDTTAQRWSTVGVEAAVRYINYWGPRDLGCNFYEGDKNSTYIASGWMWTGASYCWPVDYEWRWCDSPELTLNPTATNIRPDEADVFLFAYNNVITNNGNPASVYIDRTRALWKR